jgi:hypothetical protein
VSDPLGRRALFSPPAAPVSPSQAEGKESLYSASDVSGDTPGPPGDRRFGTVVVDCSSCGARRRLSWVEFAWRHLPFGLWIPWLHHSQLMSCPACQRRTWLQVSFFS